MFGTNGFARKAAKRPFERVNAVDLKGRWLGVARAAFAFLACGAALACVPAGQKMDSASVRSEEGVGAGAFDGPVYKDLKGLLVSAVTKEDIDRLIGRADAYLSGTIDRSGSNVPEAAADSVDVSADREGYWLALGLRSLATYRSAVALGRKVFDGSDLKLKFSDNAIVTGLMQAASIQRVFFAGQQNAAALLAYVAYPVGDVSRDKLYQSVPDWQERWLCNIGQDKQTKIPGFQYSVDQMIAGVQSFLPLVSGSQSVGVDLSVGIRNFNPQSSDLRSQDYQFKLGEPEMYAILSSLYGLRSNLKAACSYTSDNVNFLAEALLRGAGLDGAEARLVDGFSVLNRVDLFKGNQSPWWQLTGIFNGFDQLAKRARDAGKLKISNGKMLIQDALKDVRKAAWLQQKAAQLALGRQETPTMQWLLDKGRLKPMEHQIQRTASRVAEMWKVDGLSDWSAAAKECDSGFIDSPDNTRQTLTSMITGETVSYDPFAFFRSPPEDLRDLLPTDFDEGRTNGDYDRNYRKGSPMGWNQQAYAGILPDQNKGNIGDQIRIVNEAFGGFLAGAPLSAFSL